jgi:hypothetical protein
MEVSAMESHSEFLSRRCEELQARLARINAEADTICERSQALRALSNQLVRHSKAEMAAANSNFERLKSLSCELRAGCP